MEKVQFLSSSKFLFCVFFILIQFSCETREEKIIGEAVSHFQSTQSDLGLENVYFQGPVLKSRIENFASNPNYIIYGWYFVHEKDTFWIYSKVDKKFIKETSLHFSSNFDILLENNDKWQVK